MFDIVSPEIKMVGADLGEAEIETILDHRACQLSSYRANNFSLVLCTIHVCSLMVNEGI